MTASGEHIAHYRLVRKLAEGGMGEVHRAVDERLGRDVAIKLLPSHVTQTDSQTRLLREAQAAGQLNHPGIVTVHDVGIWRQRVYLVMELVDGRSLSRAARDGMTVREAVALCAEAATALAAAHRRGILHRDIKPDNIMVTSEGRVKILDFGLAKLRAQAPAPDGPPLGQDDEEALADAAMVATEVAGLDPAAESHRIVTTPAPDDTLLSPSSPTPLTPAGGATSPWASLTFAGSLLGTPAYMSPEQAASEPLDARSEVYSLGLVLYELVSGKRPLVRSSVKETLEAARAAEIPPLPPGTAPRAVVKLLSRALAPEPADRFADMDELAAELRATAAALAPHWRRRVLWLAGAGVVAGSSAAIALAAAGQNSPGTSATSPPAASDFAVRATRAITLDPGCEEYPAFTRDGREILFDGRIERDSEIQAISADGRTRRRLTHSPGWDIGATPSPDGRRVAYIHFSDTARELRVIDIAGDQQAPAIAVGLSRGFPAWTPDGDLVYGDDSGRLFRVSLDRTPLRPEVIAALPADHIAAFLAVFPDGEITASVRSQAQTGDLVRLGRAARGGDLAIIQPPITVSDCCNLRPDRAGRGLYHAALAGPDNSMTLHWRPRGGGDPIVLDRVASVLRGFDVAPGGDRVVVSGCKIQSMIGRIEGGRFLPLPRLGTAWDPAAFDQVDPDFMVVSSDRSGLAQIWRIDAEGRGDLLVDRDAKAPALSRDATRLVWMSTAAGAPGLHVSAVAGGPTLRLTTDARDDMPAFSHDGRRVYFARTTPAGARVFAVAADGSGSPEPVSPPGVVAFAVASHRARLALITVRGDGNVLRVGPPGGPFAIVPVTGAHALTAVAFSADDREILVAPRRNLIVAVRPGERAEPRVVWSAEDDTLYQIRLDRTGAVYAMVSTDEGDLYLVDGAFR